MWAEREEYGNGIYATRKFPARAKRKIIFICVVVILRSIVSGCLRYCPLQFWGANL